MNDFDYLTQLPGEEREQNWIRMRLGTLSVREGIILAAAAQADQPKDAVQAITKYGAARGSWLALKRFLRCHPFYKGDLYDPVP